MALALSIGGVGAPGVMSAISGLAAPLGAVVFAADFGDGLSLYFEGRDAAAIERLVTAKDRGELPLAGRLVLVDLYARAGQPARARRELERMAEDGLAPGDTPIWLAWLDFEAGRTFAARQQLAAIIAAPLDEDESLRGPAALSLGWQLLLQGRAREAADVFGQLAREPSLPDIDAQVPLLLGQALMWSRRYDEAEHALQGVTAVGIRADAARDLAWCHYASGEIDRAREELARIAEVGDTSRSQLAVSWATVMRRGPATMRQYLQSAYRNRPRGQDFRVFLAATADRNAAVDARALLAMIGRAAEARPPTVPVAEASDPTAIGRADAEAGSTLEPRAAPRDLRLADGFPRQRGRSKDDHTWISLLLWCVVVLLLITVAVRWLTRRRGA